MSANTYLPSIHNGQEVTGQGELNACAADFAATWLRLLGDKGKQMHSDPRLIAAAQKQAEWLQAHDFDPTDPHLGQDGSTANERVRAEGYKLPDWWPIRGNEVESASHTWDVDMAEIVGDLMNHPTHYDHMHVTRFWERSIVYGVGCAGTFFVVVTCPPEE